MDPTTASKWLDDAWPALRPPPKRSMSEWADAHFRLSAESAAEPGRWRCLPYQRGILDAISDPAVERVSWKKSARIGYTKCINVVVGYHMDEDPCPILVVQPSIEDAEGYSKEEIAPMLRDVEVLAGLVGDGTKTSAQTILHKTFPGGSLSMIGANSGRGFRRVSRRVVIFDEVDGYPPSAGAEGDQIKLGERRAEYYWNRKIIAGSTPLVAGASRIEEMFEAGDQRRYYVPCPHCGHFDFLTFDREAEHGHRMRWPDDDPDGAFFECSAGGCVIEEQHKRDMLEQGEWRAEKEFAGHASFHIWAAYSVSPNASWAQIAKEFIEATKLGVEKLKTFVNTVLGETWQERGDAPDWEKLYARRERYAIGSVPQGPIVLTCGVDVQKDRFVYEVVGWSSTKESWSIDADELHGDTAHPSTWALLDALLARTFPGGPDRDMSIAMLAIDSGYNTQVVYNWARSKPISRVIACKGQSGARMLVGAASPVEVTVRGKRLQRGYKVWPIGVDIGKSELYSFLPLRIGEDGVAPHGYCHFPEYGEDFFQQLTAEHLVRSRNKRTHRTKMEWRVIANRDNHYLDARILARVAAAVLGIDRLVAPPPPPPPSGTPPSSAPRHEPDRPVAPRKDSWLRGGQRPRWLRRR